MIDKFAITLYGRPMTKKNSQIVTSGRRVLPSRQYVAYEKECRQQMTAHRSRLPHYETGVNLRCHYYLPNRKGWPDIFGLLQATADIISDEYQTVKRKKLLVCKWLLADDRIVKSTDGSKIVGLDANNPRVEIEITLLPDDPAELDPWIRKTMRRQK